MESLKLLFIFAVTGFCASAPNVLDPRYWNSGARDHSAGNGFLPRPHFHYPPFQVHHPTIQYDYSGYQGRGYPQVPSYPVSPKHNNYPRFGNNFPSNNFPPTTLEQDDMNKGFEHPKTTIEQDDMNRGLEQSEYIPSGDIFDSESGEDYIDNIVPDSS